MTGKTGEGLLPAVPERAYRNGRGRSPPSPVGANSNGGTQGIIEIMLEDAQRGIAAGLAKAHEINSPSSIAIIDSGRNLIAFVRMDTATSASIEIAQAKAFTARSLNMKTGDIMQHVQPGGALYGMENSHRDRPFVVFGGGHPVTKGGAVVGAVGVAGGMVRVDEAMAAVVARPSRMARLAETDFCRVLQKETDRGLLRLSGGSKRGKPHRQTANLWSSSSTRIPKLEVFCVGALFSPSTSVVDSHQLDLGSRASRVDGSVIHLGWIGR